MKKATKGKQPLKVRSHFHIPKRSAIPAVDVMRRQLVAPELPPGVLPPGTKFAMDFASSDIGSLAGWANGMNGIGCGLYFPGYPILAELAQRSEYRVPIATIADEMTRKWIKLKSHGKDDDTKIQELTNRCEELDLQGLFREANRVDGTFGRSQLYVDVGDGLGSRGIPLNDEAIAKGSLRKFKVIEPMWTTPVTWNSTDPTEDTFYVPENWYVLGTDTHASRLMTFVSRPVPDLLKPSYNFGGISLTQLMEPYVNRWLRGVGSIGDLISNFSILTLAMDLTTVLAGGAPDDVVNRLKLFTQARDNQGIWAINFEEEELGATNIPLTGLHELQEQLKEQMCLPSQMPLVKFAGFSKGGGLGSGTEEEMICWDDHVNSNQISALQKHLTRALNIIQMDLWGAINKNIFYDWVPLREPTAKEIAEENKANGATAQILLDGGVITPDEERQRLIDNPNSGYNNLTGKAPGIPIDPNIKEAAENAPPQDEPKPT